MVDAAPHGKNERKGGARKNSEHAAKRHDEGLLRRRGLHGRDRGLVDDGRLALVARHQRLRLHLLNEHVVGRLGHLRLALQARQNFRGLRVGLRLRAQLLKRAREPRQPVLERDREILRAPRARPDPGVERLWDAQQAAEVHVIHHGPLLAEERKVFRAECLTPAKHIGDVANCRLHFLSGF